MLARGATSWGPFSLLGSCILPTPVQFFFSDAFVASISPCRNISASSGAAVREPRFAFCTWHISNVLSECVCAPVPMTRFAFWFSTLAVIHLREVLHCRIGYGSACVPVAIRVPASAHMICRAAGIQAASRTGQSREGRSGRGPTSGNRRQYSPMRQLSFFFLTPFALSPRARISPCALSLWRLDAHRVGGFIAPHSSDSRGCICGRPFFSEELPVS